MEIYNETVTDLLVDTWKRKPLEVRETINVCGRVETADGNGLGSIPQRDPDNYVQHLTYTLQTEQTKNKWDRVELIYLSSWFVWNVQFCLSWETVGHVPTAIVTGVNDKYPTLFYEGKEFFFFFTSSTWTLSRQLMEESQIHPTSPESTFYLFIYFTEKHLCGRADRRNGDESCSGPGLDQ